MSVPVKRLFQTHRWSHSSKMPEAEIVYSDVKFKRGTMETKGELIHLCTYELYLICIQLNIIGFLLVGILMGYTL